jgi:hypothetical protein
VYPEATLSRGISALHRAGHFEKQNALLQRVFYLFLVIPSGYPLCIVIFIQNKFLLMFYVRKKNTLIVRRVSISGPPYSSGITLHRTPPMDVHI